MLGAAALSVLLVLLLRWVPPLTSAFMLAERGSALLEGNFEYRNDYRWVPLERISPHAAIKN